MANQVFDFTDKPDEVVDQHVKCDKCKGTKKTCLILLKCSSFVCNKLYHLDCLQNVDLEVVKKSPTWFCSRTCGAPSVHITSAPSPADLQTMQKQMTEMIAKMNRMETNNFTISKRNEDLLKLADELTAKNNHLEEQLRSQRSNASLAFFGNVGDETVGDISMRPGGHSTFSAAEANYQNIFKRAQAAASATGHYHTAHSSLPAQDDPVQLALNNLSQGVVTPETNQLLSALRERRKHLPPLPNFSGKGCEWLVFKNTYQAIRDEGKFNQLELAGKLRLALKGEAAELVHQQLILAKPNADYVMQLLAKRFFKPREVISESKARVKAFPEMTTIDANQISALKCSVANHIAICTDLGRTEELVLPISESIEDKLPQELLNKWLIQVNSEVIRGNWYNFVTFLEEQEDAIKIPLRLRLKNSSKEKSKDSVEKQSHGKSPYQVNAVATVPEVITGPPKDMRRSFSGRGRGRGHSSGAARPPRYTPHNDSPRTVYQGEAPLCDFDSCGKTLFRCEEFAKKPHHNKIFHVDRYGYCKRCLRKGHATMSCPNASSLPKCRVTGCTDPANHTTVMHPPSANPKSNGTHANSNTIHVLSSQLNDSASSLFQVAKAVVKDAAGSDVPVTVFFDSGSNATLISKQLFNRLNLPGEPHALSVKWCTGSVANCSEGSFKTSLSIASAENPTERFTLHNVITLDDLSLPAQAQDPKFLKEIFPHLKDVKIPEFDCQRPQILLGLHHRHLMAPSEIVFPPGDIPSAIAEKTKLGWVVSCANLPSYNLNVVESIQSKEESSDITVDDEQKSPLEILRNLNKMVKNYIDYDITAGAHFKKEYFVTTEDVQAEKVIANTLKLVNGRYEVGLLWRNDHVLLPDNSPTALRRLYSTEATLKKKNLVSWANEHHKLLRDLGFVREATAADLCPTIPHKRINYIIGFVVINHNKTPPKPRWVHDTRCAHQGVSLNSALLPGPDNLLPLTQSLFHFRERKYAFAADVEKQFHQIQIIKEDVQCQRYFWRDCDSSKSPKIYIHTAMLFGPTDSPSKANAVRIIHADNSMMEFKSAATAAKNSMYMDDFFDSHDTVEEAAQTAQDAITMFERISWKLVDFRSNANEVINKLPSSHVNSNLLIDFDKDDASEIYKVLGSYWNPLKDIIQFKQIAEMQLREKSLKDDYHPSKRELLSFVMKIYDILGLIAHFIIRGRMIIQKVWREQLGWDEPISDDIQQLWKQWLEKFDEISVLEIPRHYGYFSNDVDDVQIHLFSDASAEAYAACAYLRFKFTDGSVKTILVFAKTRVAPLKHTTIPKMELNGAVIASRIYTMVKKQHTRIKTSSSRFWTDSEIVLKWIYNTQSKTQAFVAPRIAEIRDATSIRSWRYVPTLDNPADDGTKLNNINFGDYSQRWYHGPDFLKFEESEWPANKIEYKEEDNLLHVNAIMKTPKSIYYAGVLKIIKPSTRAKWSKYKKIVAVLFRAKNNFASLVGFISRQGGDIITPSELNLATKFIIKEIQKATWPEETSLLQAGRTLYPKKHAELASLQAFCSSDGLIRTRTRMTDNPWLPYDFKHPIILPKSHETVDAIAREYHERNGHVGTECVINRLRACFWIIGARQAVIRAVKRCLYCLKLKAKPYNPAEGNLPNFRTTLVRPFQHVGADCFGPIEVRRRNGTKHKIDVVIFVCLATHAIYMKRLNTMTTNEMIVAVQELWSRRGPVETMVSDNGRNFFGCSNILEREVTTYAADRLNITWKFNPAITPHWGGVWERLIKDVKRAIRAAFYDHSLTEFEFDCLLLQCEDVMNSRPLTHMPISPKDNSPLTPNLLLKLHPGQPMLDYHPMTDDFNHELIPRRVRGLCKAFFRRFTLEHLPIITGRTKLNGKTIRAIKLNDIVLQAEPTAHPATWTVGRVIKIYPGSDGSPKLADIQLKDGRIVLKRSAWLLRPLDYDREEFNVVTEDDTTAVVNAILVESCRATMSNSYKPTKDKFSVTVNTMILNARGISPVNEERISHVQKKKSTATTRADILREELQLNLIKYSKFCREIMEKYSKVPYNTTIGLMKDLHRIVWTKSSDVGRRTQFCSELLPKFMKDPDYQDPTNEYSVRFETMSGFTCFGDILLSLISLKIQPLWLRATSAVEAPTYVYGILQDKADVEKLVTLRHLYTSEGSIVVTKPRRSGSMPTASDEFVHALYRLQRPEVDDWYVVLTRLTKQSDTRSSLCRSLPTLSRIWDERVRAYYNQDTTQVRWEDIRVTSPYLLKRKSSDDQQTAKRTVASTIAVVNASKDESAVAARNRAIKLQESEKIYNKRVKEAEKACADIAKKLKEERENLLSIVKMGPATVDAPDDSQQIIVKLPIKLKEASSSSSSGPARFHRAAIIESDDD